MSEFVIKGRHEGLSVEDAVAFSGQFRMPAEGLKRLNDDIAAASKLPPISRAARIARLEFLRDSSAADTLWAIGLGGLSGAQVDGELAKLRRETETENYFTVVPDPQKIAEAGRRRFALQEWLKRLIAESAGTTDASPEA